MATKAQELYLDVNADSQVHPTAWKAYVEASKFFGNSSSSHQAGRLAKRCLEKARRDIASTINAPADSIVFTSGGTEADALALVGTVRAYKGEGLPHVICSDIEHAAVLETAQRLEAEGEIELDTLSVGRSSMVVPEQVAGLLKPNTVLVSVLLASNETGVLQPIAAIGSMVQAHGAFMHSDAVQGLGRLPIDVDKLKCDFLSLSAHKIGGIGGVGALYIRDKSVVEPILLGGGQEFGLRASTANVPGVAAFAAACAEISPWSTAIRNEFELRLLDALDDIEVVGKNSPRLPNTSCIRFAGCEADGLLMGLDISGIGVSTGSACSTGSIEPSRILMAMGFSTEEAKSCLRFSFPKVLSGDAIERVVDRVVALVHRAREVRF